MDILTYLRYEDCYEFIKHKEVYSLTLPVSRLKSGDFINEIIIKPDSNSPVYTKALQDQQADAKKAVEAFLGCVSQILKKGDEVRLTGSGSFAVQSSAARTGRNPRTGETIQIAASKRPVFKAGKELKDTVNG